MPKSSLEKPHIATDVAVFTVTDAKLHLLLIRRGDRTHRGEWALPGGALEIGELVRDCAARELEEETGVKTKLIGPFGYFDAPDRDPRGRAISIGYLALAHQEQLKPVAGSDAAAVQWWPVSDRPPLAFDHDAIVVRAIQALSKLDHKLELLLPLVLDRFTLVEFQAAYQGIKNAENVAASGQTETEPSKVDPGNFRKLVKKQLLDTYIRSTDQVDLSTYPHALYYEKLPTDRSPSGSAFWVSL